LFERASFQGHAPSFFVKTYGQLTKFPYFFFDFNCFHYFYRFLIVP